MIVRPTVFVVDDELHVREWLETVLSNSGFRVRCYASADEFLTRNETAAIACLILDLRMPEIDGLSFHRQLRERRMDIPTIFLTGRSDISEAVRAMQQGAVDFLQKPVSPLELVEAVHRAINRAREVRQRWEFREVVELRLASLSGSEREMLDEFVDGKTTEMIAMERGVSDEDVQQQRSRILRKTGVESVATLVRDVLLARR
jgi:two-component system, LuxR family, response regulator FixJ